MPTAREAVISAVEAFCTFSLLRRALGHSDDSGTDNIKFTEPSQVLDHIYIGNARTAANIETLSRLSISHVVNATRESLNIWNIDDITMLFHSVLGDDFLTRKVDNDIKDNSSLKINIALAFNCTDVNLAYKEGIDLFEKYQSAHKAFGRSCEYLRVPIIDRPYEDAIQHFESVYNFIENAMNKNPSSKVLVHCQAGVSRSSTVCLAYLIRKGYTGNEAWKILKEKHEPAKPNRGFAKQLVRYYRQINQHDQEWEQNCSEIRKLYI
jgi:protein-tyrosine phosphatase